MASGGHDEVWDDGDPFAERPRRRRQRWVAGIAVAALVIVGAWTVSAVALGGRPASEPDLTPLAGAASTPRPTVSSESTSSPRTPSPVASTHPLTPLPPPLPTPLPTPIAPPPVPAGPDTATLPDECPGLYSPSMYTYLSVGEALPLNDGTTLAPPFSKSPDVATLQTGLPGLVCTWGSAGHFGLLTQANEVTAAQSAAAVSALTASGFDCYAQSSGTRCVVKGAGDDETWGESHFLRGNVWLCTFWSNFAPTGYTADIVATLWD